MENLEKYLGKTYQESDEESIFIYRIIKKGGNYGLDCREAQLKPCRVWMYEDISEDNSDFVKTFIPERDSECIAKEISNERYIELETRLLRLKQQYDTFEEHVKNFLKEYGRLE